MIVPPYMLLRLARLDDPAMAPVVDAARRSLSLDGTFRDARGGFRVGDARGGDVRSGEVRVGESPPPTRARGSATPGPRPLPRRLWQSGALNESVSDVFGALVEQHAMAQDVEDVRGLDPQPASMDEYIDTKDDNGGVHINSGLPNRVLYLAAAAIGGKACEGAGHVWYDTITTGEIRADSDFAQFAAATVEAASARFGEASRERDAVADAWSTVGVAWEGETKK